MNCPHCQKEFQDNYAEANCPFCGGWLPEREHPVVKPDKTLPAVKFQTAKFFLFLLGAPILTMISVWLDHADNELYPVAVGFYGGGVAGMACGILLGLRFGKTWPARVLLCLLYSAVMGVVCIMLCFAGCTLGGYQFTLH
jgi:hypothetical protein